ncbi:hypothetical protein Tco_0145633 [Tanacetum coccineum]
MVAPVISISSDTSKKSVGSHAPRVILFGDIPAIIPIIPEVHVVPADPIVTSEVGTISVVSPGGAIPFGRPYHTHFNGSHKLLTARKRVKPIPARRLAWRHVSHHSLDHHSSPDSSSSSAPSDHSLSGHTPPDTTDADSSTPLRFVHRSLARTPCIVRLLDVRGSSSKRSLDSSLPSFRPSCKRCRSPTALVPLPTHVSRLIAPTPADLLPPRKRFRDSYSPEDSREEHMKVDTDDAEVIAYIGISEGVIAHLEDCVGMGFEIVASDVREDDEEFEAEASAADTREIGLTVFVSTWHFHIRSFVRTMTITRSGMTPEAIEELINRRVEETLAAHEVTRAANALEAENQSQNGSDGDNGNGGNGNGENRNGGNGIPNENGRGDRPVARECTYQDFMKCQPLNFKGTEGVVDLIMWFEKMETMFHISNYPEKSQVKYVTCTLLNGALTWWNSHKRTIGIEAAIS